MNMNIKMTGGNYLQDCLNDFERVSKRRFGDECDLDKIERRVACLRSGKVSLVELIAKFKECSEEERWMRAYWLLPPVDDLSEHEKSRTFSFHQFSGKHERKKIQELLDMVRQIELVSLILRFIRPDEYGILTPPVASILRLPSADNAVDTYRDYLRNIRKIRDHGVYGFGSAAEVDKALWVLSQKCADGEFKEPKIRRAFEGDDFMLRLRTGNMVRPLFSLTPTRLASAFYDESNPSGNNSLLAGLVGCYALEDNIKKWVKIEKVTELAKQFARGEGKNFKPALKHYILAIRSKSPSSFPMLSSMNLDYLNKLRNNIIHGHSLNASELKKLIEAVAKMEKALNRS